MSDETTWYFIVDDEEGRRQEGPVSTGELQAMLSAGTLSADTLVWHEGMTDWDQIGTVSHFSQPEGQDSSPEAPPAAPAQPPGAEQPEMAAGAVDEPDTVTIRDMGNHTVRFSKSRNRLLVATNDYYAGPLELTKLDLLGFLTAMETLAPQNPPDKGTDAA